MRDNALVTAERDGYVANTLRRVERGSFGWYTNASKCFRDDALGLPRSETDARFRGLWSGGCSINLPDGERETTAEGSAMCRNLACSTTIRDAHRLILERKSTDNREVASTAVPAERDGMSRIASLDLRNSKTA